MLGEISALLTSVCWSVSSVSFSSAARRIGSTTLNHVRLWFALLFLSLIHCAAFQTPFPFHSQHRQLLWLGLSGFVGYIIGDSMIFESLVLIGPRLCMLMLTLSPIFGAVFGWLLLDERLNSLEMIAILVTIGGIVMVISDVHRGHGDSAGQYAVGILLGIGGAVCQAGGLLLSKIGMRGGISPFSANLIRLLAAAFVMGVLAVFKGTMLSDFRKLRDTRALTGTLSGTIFGPVFGVVCSLYSVVHTQIGIASTLMSLPPVFLLPVSRFLYHERITWMALLGTLISFGGVVLLFLSR